SVTLQMLDRLVALAVRQMHVLGRDVVLEIDEGLAAALRGDLPYRGDRMADQIQLWQRQLARRRVMAGMGRRASAGLKAAAHGLDEAEAADDGAGAEMAGCKAAGHERSDR